MKRLCTLGALLCLLAIPGKAQVSVSLAPSVHPQFVDSTGKVLAGGFLYTYIAGTTTRQDTYTDSTGTIINAWPIPLDATGSPSNGSTQAGIWLANQSYKLCAYNSAVIQQWCTDNVSAYQILNNIQNIVFGNVTSDPTGAAGEIGYRSDLPCFRGYTTFWDCFVTYTGIQTLTNKTLTSPTVTGTVAGAPAIPNASLATPTINNITLTGAPATYLSATNDITTGTTLNTLTKMLGATAIIATAGDTGGVIGITVAGAGKAGLATLQQNGATACVFDNATTAGDYAQISATIAGNCHDAGATYPSSGQVIGRANVTAGAGTNGLILFGPEIKPQVAVAKVDLTAQGANISSTPLITPSANGFYRMSCYSVITQAATTSSTVPTCNSIYTDADSGIAETVPVAAGGTTNIVGFPSSLATGGTGGIFFAKSGVAISYSTSNYASVGATPMQYAIHLRLEGPL